MVEIIPKPKTRKKIKISLIDIAYYSVISLLSVVLLAYLLSFFWQKKMDDQLVELNSLIQERQNPEAQALERGVLDFNEKLKAFKHSFESYRKASNFFEFLSSLCHQKVFFSKTDLNVGESKVALTANTESFRTLKEQILIFDQEESIGNVDLSRVAIPDEGGISFSISLPLKTQIFK